MHAPKSENGNVYPKMPPFHLPCPPPRAGKPHRPVPRGSCTGRRGRWAARRPPGGGACGGSGTSNPAALRDRKGRTFLFWGGVWTHSHSPPTPRRTPPPEGPRTQRVLNNRKNTRGGGASTRPDQPWWDPPSRGSSPVLIFFKKNRKSSFCGFHSFKGVLPLLSPRKS